MKGASAQHWQSLAAPPDLGAEEIHLWQYSLQPPETSIDLFKSLLSPEEIARAERLLRPADRKLFIVGRGRLRQLLGSYLGCEPARLELTTLPQGKPVLVEPRLQFNLSHSGELALLAVARSTALGVDLEQMRPEFDWQPLASRYFSREEQLALQQLPPRQQTAGFFSVWTRKEAWLKARGSGFHLPFDTFDVSAPPAPAALLRHQGNPAAPGAWHLEDIPIGASYCATLAYPPPKRGVLLLNLSPGSN